MGKFSAQSIRLNVQIEDETFVRFVGDDNEVLDFPDVVIERLCRLRADAGERSLLVVVDVTERSVLWRYHRIRVQICLNLISDQLLITKSLVIYPLHKEFVEVEVVLHQESYVARLKLQRFVAQDL